jgi:hypothetical protein
MSPAVVRSARGRGKQLSQWSVIGWVTKIYYHKLFRALEGTLSRWSRFLPSFPCHVLSQHDEKHVVPTPLSGIRVERRRISDFDGIKFVYTF